MAKKQKNTTFVIRRGTAFFPALSKPDTAYNDLGVYKADVWLSDEDSAPVIEKIQEVARRHMGEELEVADGTMKKKVKGKDRWVPNAENPCFSPAFDRETGELTGGFIFKIQAKNRLNKEGDLWDRRPPTIDSKKRVIPASTQIWGGTVMNVEVEVYEWIFNGGKGINLQPKMVQIIDLKGPSGEIDTSAFDEEDGYEMDDASDHEAFDEDHSPEDDNNDDSDY